MSCVHSARANGEGRGNEERTEKFPSLAPLRRLQNAPPPQPQLDCNRRPRRAARRWALARRQRRQTCRISKFLSGSSTFRKQRGGWVAGGWVGGSNCLGKQARASDRDPLSSSAASTSTCDISGNAPFPRSQGWQNVDLFSKFTNRTWMAQSNIRRGKVASSPRGLTNHHLWTCEAL